MRRLARLGVWAAAGVTAAAFLAPFVQAQRNPETDLKAAFVSKLPQFVHWPPEATPSVFQICALAPPGFVQALEALTIGETVGNRGMAVRALEGEDEDVDQCQVLFLAAGRGAARRALLQRAGAQPILTIGESNAFLEEGGMIVLRLRDGRVRFEIDAAATAGAGLQVSSQVMRLALAVRDGSR